MRSWLEKGAVVVGIVAAASLGRPAAAFTNGQEGHERITQDALSVLLPGLVDEAVYWNNEQDSGDEQETFWMHFDRCVFVEGFDYVNQQLRLTTDALDPVDPDPYRAAKQLGRMLHGVQDFYSHSNWVNLVEERHGTAELSSPRALFERGSRYWAGADYLGPVREDILFGERLPGEGLPPGWTATQSMTSTIPVVTDASGGRWRALITHWGVSGDAQCLDVRPDIVTVSPFPPHSVSVDRRRLRHGESDSCEPDYVELNKDGSSRPHWADAFRLATWQSEQAWCQVLGIAQDRYGLAGVGTAMSLMTVPGTHVHAPETSCGPLPHQGSLEMQVALEQMTTPPQTVGAASRTYGLSFYTADLHESAVTRFALGGQVRSTSFPPGSVPTLSLCVDPNASVGVSLVGYDDLGSPAVFDEADHPMAGVTLPLTATGSATSVTLGSPTNTSMRIRVAYDVTDLDHDGWSRCEELAHGGSDADSDGDDDGLLDGEEDKFGADPFDPDTDGDGIEDGAEVDCGTDPGRPWTEGNPLPDGDTCLFLPVDPDPRDDDGDQLVDELEGPWGLSSKDPDGDRDGWVDGLDPSWLADLLDTVTSDQLAVPKGLTEDQHRTALKELALDAELALQKWEDPKKAQDDLTGVTTGLVACPPEKGEPDPTSACAATLALLGAVGATYP